MIYIPPPATLAAFPNKVRTKHKAYLKSGGLLKGEKMRISSTNGIPTGLFVMETKTHKDKKRDIRIEFAKRTVQTALGGASVGTMVGAAFVAPLAPVVLAVVGAVAGAVASTTLGAESDQAEDTGDYDKEEPSL